MKSGQQTISYDPYDVELNADPYPMFRRLRDEHRLRSIPFMFLSADRSVAAKVSALRLRCRLRTALGSRVPGNVRHRSSAPSAYSEIIVRWHFSHPGNSIDRVLLGGSLRQTASGWNGWSLGIAPGF